MSIISVSLRLSLLFSLLAFLTQCGGETPPAEPETSPTPSQATLGLESQSKDQPAPSDSEKATPAPQTKAPAPGTSYQLTMRFEGYTQQVSRSMWFPLPTVASPSQSALFVVTEASRSAASPAPESGPRDLALGIDPGGLRSNDGRPLSPGRVYDVQLNQTAAERWAVQISPQP